jgi:hypothetical protein
MAVIKSGATSDQWTIDPTSKAGRMTLYDSAGNAVSSVAGLGGVRQIPSIVTQGVFVSTLNSSSAQINAGITWDGLSESTLGVSGIQINTFLDKHHTVTLFQSMNGTNWDISTSYKVPASNGTGRTFQATASYYKISVKNETASNTTICRIQTALCPIVEALPTSLTSGGNLKVTANAEWQDSGLTTGLYALSTFRTLGTAVSPQNIFTLENPAASTVNIAIRTLSVATDSTAALATVAPQVSTSRAAALPADGTVLTATKYQTSFAAPVAIARGGNASNGGAATAITAVAGTALWTQFIDRGHTAAGWYTHITYSLIPDVGTDLRQIVLVPGEAILVQSLTAMAATTHIIVNCSWHEITSI